MAQTVDASFGIAATDHLKIKRIFVHPCWRGLSLHLEFVANCGRYADPWRANLVKSLCLAGIHRVIAVLLDRLGKAHAGVLDALDQTHVPLNVDAG